jgi:hypothetical protein
MTTSRGPDATWCRGAPRAPATTAHMVATAAIGIQRRSDGATPMRALCGASSLEWRPVGGVISSAASCPTCRTMAAERLRRPRPLRELLGEGSAS